MDTLCTTRSQLLNSPLYRLTIASLVSRSQTLLLPVLRKRPAKEKGLGVSLYRSCAGFLWRLLADTSYRVVGKVLVANQQWLMTVSY